MSPDKVIFVPIADTSAKYEFSGVVKIFRYNGENIVDNFIRNNTYDLVCHFP